MGRRKAKSISEYRGVWLFTMFDLPVYDKPRRRAYTRFRKLLVKEGFSQLQYSVYARYFASEDTAKPFKRKIKKALPPEGEVRLMMVTDHQFGRMENFIGKTPENPEKPPGQLMLF